MPLPRGTVPMLCIFPEVREFGDLLVVGQQHWGICAVHIRFLPPGILNMKILCIAHIHVKKELLSMKSFEPLLCRQLSCFVHVINLMLAHSMNRNAIPFRFVMLIKQVCVILSSI